LSAAGCRNRNYPFAEIIFRFIFAALKKQKGATDFQNIKIK